MNRERTSQLIAGAMRAELEAIRAEEQRKSATEAMFAVLPTAALLTRIRERVIRAAVEAFEAANR